MKLKNLYIAGTVTLVSLLAYFLGWSGLMTIDQIKVTGLSKTQKVSSLTSKEVIKLSGIKIGQPIARVNSSSVKRKLLALPQVLDVKVNRKLPNSVLIELKMRKVEIAVTASGGGFLVGFSHS